MSSSRGAGDKGKAIATDADDLHRHQRRRRSTSSLHINESPMSQFDDNITVSLSDDDEDIRRDQILADEQFARQLEQRQTSFEAAIRGGRGSRGASQSHQPSGGDQSLGGDGNEEEQEVNVGGKLLKAELFTRHMRKVRCKVQKKGMPEQFELFCNYCSKKYNFIAGGGYGTFQRHINSKHPVEAGIGKSQTQLKKGMFAEGTSPLFKYDSIEARDAAARFVSVESLAFKFADSMHFENWMSKVQPAQKRIPRTSMTRTIRNNVRTYRINLRNMFNKLDHRVSICSDIWDDCLGINHYMGITCHWIDSSWNLNKRIIAYRKFNDTHSATNIAALIIKIAHQFKIADKIFSIGFDNASANTASVRELILECNPVLGGKYFHTRCICHILNLAVQDGLKIYKDSIEPIRNAVYYLHSHKN